MFYQHIQTNNQGLYATTPSPRRKHVQGRRSCCTMIPATRGHTLWRSLASHMRSVAATFLSTRSWMNKSDPPSKRAPWTNLSTNPSIYYPMPTTSPQPCWFIWRHMGHLNAVQAASLGDSFPGHPQHPTFREGLLILFLAPFLIHQLGDARHLLGRSLLLAPSAEMGLCTLYVSPRKHRHVAKTVSHHGTVKPPYSFNHSRSPVAVILLPVTFTRQVFTRIPLMPC